MVVSQYSQNQNNILFTGKREAVTAYCNSESVDNISAYVATVNTAPYSFTSDYNNALYSLDIQGNTEQNGTPSPTNPVDIVNMGNDSITITVQSDNLSKNIIIPHEITLENGTKVEINFAKVGDYADTLEISKGKVIYTQNIKCVKLTSNMNWRKYSSVENHFDIALNNVYSARDKNYVLSNYYVANKVNNAYYSNNDYAVMAVDGSRIRFKDKDCSTLEEWIAKVKAYEDSGIPLSVCYVLTIPIETDITSEIENYTDFMSTPYNTNLSIDIESTLAPSSETLKYLKWGGKTE